MDIPKTSDHIQINIRIPNPSQEPPVSSKPPNQDLKDMDVICTFKIKIESQNLAYGVPKTSDHIQINIRMPNPRQEPPASFKAQNHDLKDTDVLCTFKIKIESHKSDQWYIKDQ